MSNTVKVFAVMIALALCPVSSPAKDKKTSKAAESVTGCLEKGDEANEFKITEGGKSYGLRSSAVKLGDHLGHKVTVTGMPYKEHAKKAAKAGEENEHLRVTDLKMVSTTCP